MLIVLKPDATRNDIERVCSAVRAIDLVPHEIAGRERVAIGVTGNRGPIEAAGLEGLPGVAELIRVTKPWKLVGREMQPDDTIVRVADVEIGGEAIVVIAGPCSVESAEQTLVAAQAVARHGARILRGGAFKPRTSPYAFQGLRAEGLLILERVRSATGLPVVSEAVETETFDRVESSADMVQIGSRNMQNFALLRRAGRSHRPILLKRSMSATLAEFLMAAEYVLSEGNRRVVLCERGIRAFSDYSRFTLDLSIVPELKRLSHLPVLVDPSHAAGKRELVGPLARAAIAAGADGLMVEIHPDPERALSDGPQALTPAQFAGLMEEIRAVARAVGRRVEVAA